MDFDFQSTSRRCALHWNFAHLGCNLDRYSIISLPVHVKIICNFDGPRRNLGFVITDGNSFCEAVLIMLIL